jgi:pectate lyase
MRMLAVSLLMVIGLALGAGAFAEPPAFPGAEGHGAASVGGRRGAVLVVDSLADSGPGTLRAALEASGRRTVIFRVGGTITLQSPLVISNPYVTVAGQTAPGGGIQIRNDPYAPYGLASDSFTSLVIATHDVVIRYLRIRPGPLTPNRNCTGPNAVVHPEGRSTCVDAGDIQAIELEESAQRVMLDHLSLYWASDEIVDLNGAQNVSLQWSILAEGMDFVLYEGFHGRVTQNHGHGVLMGSTTGAAAGERNGRIAFHHDLFALLVDRAPQLAGNCPSPSDPLACASDAVNNVVYGWADYGVSLSNLLGHSYMNVVGNYFRDGPDTQRISRGFVMNDWQRHAEALVPDARLGLHLSQNWRWKSDEVQVGIQPQCSRWNEATARWDLCDATSYGSARYATPAITTTDPLTAGRQVLAGAGASRRLEANGAWRAVRDATDTRVVADATYGTGRIIGSYEEFPGWPKLANSTPPSDLDRDGMPDAWEDRHCLDATRANAALDTDRDGYTDLEEYLNGTPPCGG